MKKSNLLILMAGEGTKLKQYYEEPKPYIRVNGLRLIEWVLLNTNLNYNHIVVARKESAEKYDLEDIMKKYTSSSSIVKLDKLTEGAAVTALTAKDFINNENELVIINCDQYLECNLKKLLNEFKEENVDGGILTVQKKDDIKWSYVKLGEDNYAVEVAEKKPISTNATVGVYYWKKGSDFVKFAEEMIKKDIRVNNEFYVCPVYNEAIKSDKKISIKNIKNLWPLGTNEEIENFIKFSKTIEK
tara:strand:- start:279 stop:1010 length:732 start_codon:yes stop_codon:yes gene_type:complete